MRFLKQFFILILAIFIFLPMTSAKTINIFIFHSDTCSHCKEELEYLNELNKTYDLDIHKYEISSKENQELLRKVKAFMNRETSYVPYTVIGTEVFVGFNTVSKAQMENLIENYQTDYYCDKLGAYLGLSEACSDEPVEPVEPKEEKDKITIPIIGEVDPKTFSLPLIAIVIGLVDGFNPCAMWVLIFLLSMLIGMKNRKKMWILGLTFIVTSASVYLLIMLAWLNIVAEFSTVRALQIIIAIVALIAAAFNIRSYIISLKKDDGCTVTTKESRKSIINRIKKIVSLEEASENKKRFSFLLALLGIIALAISVNVIELACSAGLPLIFTQILAMNDVSSVSKLIYILIYILFFMLDDIIVFTIAMFTFKITGISTKYTKYSHLIGGIIMLIIGILMILKPEWIMFNF